MICSLRASRLHALVSFDTAGHRWLTVGFQGAEMRWEWSVIVHPMAPSSICVCDSVPAACWAEVSSIFTLLFRIKSVSVTLLRACVQKAFSVLRLCVFSVSVNIRLPACWKITSLCVLLSCWVNAARWGAGHPSGNIPWWSPSSPDHQKQARICGWCSFDWNKADLFIFIL